MQPELLARSFMRGQCTIKPLHPDGPVSDDLLDHFERG